MAHGLNYTSEDKVAKYLAEEQAAQFSQEKMDEVTSQKLGRSKMSPELTDELRAAKKMAAVKGWNLDKCVVCGAGIFSKDKREVGNLCRAHMGLKSAVMNILTKRKQATLKPEDIQSLLRTNTVRNGPFYPNPDASKAVKAGWRG